MTETETRTSFNVKVEYVLALARILVGWLFLWAFLDKTFGLGYPTSSSDAWINGGSPTEGFLRFGTSGIFQDFYTSIAGNAIVDWLFMIALLALGISLIIGIGLRIAAYGGTVFFLLLWGANVPPANNPIIDEHIIYITLLWILYKLRAGRYFGLGKWWSSTSLVRRLPWLE